jgi:hypothetical protein
MEALGKFMKAFNKKRMISFSLIIIVLVLSALSGN